MILLNYRAFNFCLKRLSEEEIFSFSRVEGVNTKRKTRNNNSKAFTVLIIKCDQHQREKSSTAIVCSFRSGCGVKVNNNLKEFARLEAIRVSVEKRKSCNSQKKITNVALTRDSLACDCVWFHFHFKCISRSALSSTLRAVRRRKAVTIETLLGFVIYFPLRFHV